MMEPNETHCRDDQCVCHGEGKLIWTVDLYRWTHQLLCNTGGLIFMEVEDEIEVYDYVGDTPGMRGNPVRDAPPLLTVDDYIRCSGCNRLLLKAGRHQKFCPTCARESLKRRKRDWIRRRRELERTVQNG